MALPRGAVGRYVVCHTHFLFNRNVYQVKTKCRVQFWLPSIFLFESYDPLFFFIPKGSANCKDVPSLAIIDFFITYINTLFSKVPKNDFPKYQCNLTSPFNVLNLLGHAGSAPDQVPSF